MAGSGSPLACEELRQADEALPLPVDSLLLPPHGPPPSVHARNGDDDEKKEAAEEGLHVMRAPVLDDGAWARWMG